MSRLTSIVDLVAVLSSHPGELQKFRKDPKAILEKYGLTGKISKKEINQILKSSSLKRHSAAVTKLVITTPIECPNAGT